MQSSEYKMLLAEIEKLKFHNTTLLTLIGLMNEEKMQVPTIHETVVMFDLSKNDLREFTKLIQNYDGNNFALEQRALIINPIFKKDNIIAILNSFITSGMFKKQSDEILKSYE